MIRLELVHARCKAGANARPWRRARRLGAVVGFAASNRVIERCRVTAVTSASISGMCGATEPSRSCCSNAASVPTSVQLHARTKTAVLGRKWAFPGQTTGQLSRPTNARIFRQPRPYACHIFVDRPLRVSTRYFRQNTALLQATGGRRRRSRCGHLVHSNSRARQEL